MQLKIKIPTIACDACKKTITSAICALDSGAKIDVDIERKVVCIEAQASEASIREAIVEVGHTPE